MWVRSRLDTIHGSQIRRAIQNCVIFGMSYCEFAMIYRIDGRLGEWRIVGTWV